MTEGGPKIVCDSCHRTYLWKPQLAGKRVKCKCGQPITVAEAPPPEEDIYDVAAGPYDEAPAKLPHMSLGVAPPPFLPVATAVLPLAYAHATTVRQGQLADSALYHKLRDFYAPLTMLSVGAVLYLGYILTHYHFGPAGMLGASIGLMILNAIETGLLIAFAFIAAGAMGVSFGGLGPAILKFAAISLLSDGVTAWVNALAHWSSGGGLLGIAACYPISFAIYWISFVTLFGLGIGESWLAVVLLSVFYFTLRIIVLVLIAGLLVSVASRSHAIAPVPGAATPPAFSGGPLPATPGAPSAPGAPARPSFSTILVQRLQSAHLLLEARAYITVTSRPAESPAIQALYAAGCKNVWFQVSQDPRRRAYPLALIAELPDDPQQRALCYDAAKKYCDQHARGLTPTDRGDPYLILPTLK